jgi:superfamily II DNA or RNA helicase
MPLHPKAKEFAKSGLFAGLRSFEDLEKRIAAIPENKVKGDAFEVFAEAYLATQRKHDTHLVWPRSATPLDVLGKLGLGEMDYGVDGVLQTLLGDLSAYQVKFRAGREPMTWRELSTFMGLADSPHIRSRILITNCDELPAVMNERQGFFCIRGSDLDRMDPSDFQAIESWLAEAVVQPTKKKPLPHQEEALADIVPSLQKDDRATAIMACGTGKTLVTLWTAEQLGSQKILVLLPSLALLRQTLHEWLKETSLNSLAYLCVCSDPTVKGDADAISTAQSDLDFEVSTNPQNVRRFLDAPFKGTKVIFSTYQSASVVGNAMKKGESFDLGIFDEAHKTAGREGRNYGYALDDKNLPIAKRLFVTATPRHYNPSKRNKEGEATVAFSMDDPNVYGEQCHTLSFSKAANLGIICGYKVIISVITSDQVTDELLSKGLVTVKGDDIRARQVANQIALRDAAAKYGVSKIFTFHSTVKSAASFVAEAGEGVRSHLPEFSAFHVSGEMPAAHRELLMRDFRNIPKAVMSNARCLTEGVDVPAVDMVAFLSPKKSKVDIVQAIGRAMRKSEGKETGYVLVPLYLEQKEGESLDKAIERANFEEIWDVLQSLKEQDEILAQLITQSAQSRGAGKGWDDSNFTDRIDFTGPALALESIRASVTTHVLEHLESSWDVNFGKLVKFKEEHGHCKVPGNSKTDKELGKWTSHQRTYYTQKKLSDDRIGKLEALGFEWDPLAADWQLWFQALLEYKAEYGNCRVPDIYKKAKGLSSWIKNQRKYFHAETLSYERISKLEGLGFEWDPLTTDWDRMFDALNAYKSKHGDCRVPQRYKINISLSHWVRNQRDSFKSGKLSAERIGKLDAIGFEWDPLNSDWVIFFEELKAFREKYGDCRVSRTKEEFKELANWISNQRSLYKKGKLSPERISKLESLGYEWDILDSDWSRYFDALTEYKSKNGSCRVPYSFSEYPRLGIWVARQKRFFERGKLSPDRIARLDALGFEWNTIDVWQESFDALVAYKNKHGDCRVPFNYQPNKKLAIWVANQRGDYKTGKLYKDRIAKLESLGFDWNTLASDWENSFGQLENYKKTFGNCRVSQKSHTHAALGKWVSHQRSSYNSGRLSPDRIKRLEDLGFEWNTFTGDWDRMFGALKAYRAEHGDCCVAGSSKTNKDLGLWVKTQRRLYKQGRLPQDRITKLEAIGFVWALQSRGR